VLAPLTAGTFDETRPPLGAGRTVALVLRPIEKHPGNATSCWRK
jgi:hypothetical protein